MATLQLAVNASLQVELANQPETFPAAAFWIVFTDAWAFFSIEIPKLGIGLMACRLFIPGRKVQIFVLTCCITLNLLSIVGFVITYVQCSPVASQFDPWKYPDGRCWDRAIQLIFACTMGGESSFYDIMKIPTSWWHIGFSAVANLGFSVWPASVIWNLNMPLQRRLGTMALMGLGIA